MKRLIFILSIILVSYFAKAQDTSKVFNAYTEVEQYVNSKIQVWEQRGKYEPISEYETRISIANRNKEVEKYTGEALKIYAPKHINLIGTATLGVYNPDKQIFTLKIPGTEEIAMPVNLNDAPDFEKLFKNYYITNVKWALYKQQYVIYSAEIYVNNKLYEFSATKHTDWGKEAVLSIASTSQSETDAMNEYIKVVNSVKERIETWKVRGEFETTEEYNARISPAKEKQQLKLYTNDALTTLAAQEIDIQKAELSKYDPDNKKYTLNIPNSKPIFFTVQANYAPDFKKNFNVAKLSNISYGLQILENQYVISNCTFVLNDTTKFVFDATKDADFGTTMVTAIDLNNLDAAYTSKSDKKMIKTPPELGIENIVFTDADSNQRIDADEDVKITFILKNTGKGAAYNMTLKVSELNGIKGLNYQPRQPLKNLAPGSEKQIIINIKGTMALTAGKANFKIEVAEANGFDADAKLISIETKEFLQPAIKIADSKFVTQTGGKIELGGNVILKVLVQNSGGGTAKNVNLTFVNPQNVIAISQQKFSFDKLLSGESKLIDYEFLINKIFQGKEIGVELKLTETYGKYGIDSVFSVSLEQKLAANSAINIIASSGGGFITASLSSDVDKNIPENTTKNPNRFALVIGNENYTKYQNNLSNEANVDFANSDASTFATYCEKTLGVPKDNLTLITDAISSRMNQEIEKICKLAQYSNGKAELIVYYAGHGFPDEVSKESFIMPVDISGANVTSGIKLSELYLKLTESGAQRVTVFLDACFSGGGRNAGLLAARGVKIKPKEELIKGSLVVFTASSGEQSSLPYKDKMHGMFTYFLLKKLQETKGNVSYKSLSEFIKSEVQLNSVKINNKDQNPDLLYSKDVNDLWENWNMQ